MTNFHIDVEKKSQEPTRLVAKRALRIVLSWNSILQDCDTHNLKNSMENVIIIYRFVRIVDDGSRFTGWTYC